MSVMHLPAVRGQTLPAPFAASMGVRSETGDAEATFALLGINHRTRTATYGLRVVNGTASDLFCDIIGRQRNGLEKRAYPICFRIPPQSAKMAHVFVRLDEFRALNCVVAEIHGEHLAFSVEALGPENDWMRGALIALACAVPLLGLFLFFAVALSQPHIALAAPATALAGSWIQAQYEARGGGSVTYDVLGADGQIVAAGRLDRAYGTIPVHLPPGARERTYALRLNSHGLLGGDTQMQVITAVPMPVRKIFAKADVSQIVSLATEPATVRAGQAFSVRYAANAEHGTLRLTDDSGTIWGQRTFSHDGIARFVAPKFAKERELRITLAVQRGASHAESAVGLVVLADPPARSLQPDGTNPTNDVFSVARTRVPTGGLIRVTILSIPRSLRIALLDQNAHELDAATVSKGQRVISLRAPNVDGAHEYIVSGSFGAGTGAQTIVEPVVVGSP